MSYGDIIEEMWELLDLHGKIIENSYNFHDNFEVRIQNAEEAFELFLLFRATSLFHEMYCLAEMNIHFSNIYTSFLYNILPNESTNLLHTLESTIHKAKDIFEYLDSIKSHVTDKTLNLIIQQQFAVADILTSLESLKNCIET